MTRTVTLDLDNPGDVERVWMQVARRRAVLDVDPPLRAAIIRRCSYMPAGVAAPILQDLDELHPELVLEAHFAAILEYMPHSPQRPVHD